MDNYLTELFHCFGIENFAQVKLNSHLITKPYKLSRAGFDEGKELYAIILAVPYLVKNQEKNISAYAFANDYHLYFKKLFGFILPKLKEKNPDYSFSGFADDSPINERVVAAIGGLGILGLNGMLITEKYSSYVFLGEIITDMPLDTKELEVKKCEECGACMRACPKNDCGVCLSELTQKKGELTDKEKFAIQKYDSAWGCDICQEVCPHTKKAIKTGTIYTNINFFTENIISKLSSSILDSMSDEEFSTRAYSWRKRDTIRRNLLLLEDKSDQTPS